MSIKKTLLDPKQFLQPEAYFPYRTPISTSPVLPAKVLSFFSHYPIPKDFHPFHARYESAIHVGLKIISDNFERSVCNRTLYQSQKINTYLSCVKAVGIRRS